MRFRAVATAVAVWCVRRGNGERLYAKCGIRSRPRRTGSMGRRRGGRRVLRSMAAAGAAASRRRASRRVASAWRY